MFLYVQKDQSFWKGSASQSSIVILDIASKLEHFVPQLRILQREES